jgi:Mrp family chromosome partitioning ATPase
MLSLAVITPNTVAADGIEQMLEESDGFRCCYKAAPLPHAADAIRSLRVHDPELILLDLGDWDAICHLAVQISKANIRAVVIGFLPKWNRVEQATFEDAGIRGLLQDPFSPADLEAAVYEALHRERPVTNRNILAFLPAKAGGGCSTVALHTAGALAHTLNHKVLLIESDRRSGVLSILLNLENSSGISEALQRAGELTNLEWQQHYRVAFGMHLLLANPARRGPLPSWAGYYQLLRFLQEQYEYLIVDLPEVVNQATAEVVKCARGVFIVCTPEVPSLRMAAQRSAELEECEISPEHIHVLVNRWERSSLTVQDVEKTLRRPVFATIPNDYGHLKKAILESRLVSEDTPFAEGCLSLARKLSGLPVAVGSSKFALLKRLGRITS